MYPRSSLQIDEDLTLQFLNEEDAEAIFRIIDKDREYLKQWLPWVDHVGSLESERASLRELRKLANQNQAYNYGIFYQGEPAGAIGYHDIQLTIRSIEIGYWIASDQQGKGIITRACRALIKQAFMEMQMNKVVIRCATNNTRSCAVPQRLGFQHEGTLRATQLLNNQYEDLHIFGLLANEWKQRKQTS